MPNDDKKWPFDRGSLVLMYGAPSPPREIPFQTAPPVIPVPFDPTIPVMPKPIDAQPVTPVSREEFATAMESLRASIREVEHELQKKHNEAVAEMQRQRDNWSRTAHEREQENVELRAEVKRLKKRVNKLLRKA